MREPYCHSPLQSATLLPQHYYYLRWPESACSLFCNFCYVLHFFYKVYVGFYHVCVTGQLFENMAVQQPGHVYIINNPYFSLKHSEYFLMGSQTN